MSSQDLKSQIYKLSVCDRLELLSLLSAIAHSLQNDLRPRSPEPEDIVDRLTGLLKIDFCFICLYYSTPLWYMTGVNTLR